MIPGMSRLLRLGLASLSTVMFLACSLFPHLALDFDADAAGSSVAAPSADTTSTAMSAGPSTSSPETSIQIAPTDAGDPCLAAPPRSAHPLPDSPCANEHVDANACGYAPPISATSGHSPPPPTLSLLSISRT